MSESIPAHDPQEVDEDDEIEVEIPIYPDEQDIAEQRRFHVAQAIGYAASELDARTFGEYVLILCDVIEHGRLPDAKPKRNLKPVA